MTWGASRSKCAARRASLRPRNRRLPASLRSALDGMDENDLGTRMQRSSDRLRSGSFSDPVETALTSDLQKLGQQVGDAARALGSAQHTSKDAELNRAMDDLSRLRDQLAGLGGRPSRQGKPRAGQPVATARTGQPGRAAGQVGNGQRQGKRSPATAGQAGGQAAGRRSGGNPAAAAIATGMWRRL